MALLGNVYGSKRNQWQLLNLYVVVAYNASCVFELGVRSLVQWHVTGSEEGIGDEYEFEEEPGSKANQW